MDFYCYAKEQFDRSKLKKLNIKCTTHAYTWWKKNVNPQNWLHFQLLLRNISNPVPGEYTYFLIVFDFSVVIHENSRGITSKKKISQPHGKYWFDHIFSFELKWLKSTFNCLKMNLSECWSVWNWIDRFGECFPYCWLYSVLSFNRHWWIWRCALIGEGCARSHHRTRLVSHIFAKREWIYILLLWFTIFSIGLTLITDNQSVV